MAYPLNRAIIACSVSALALAIVTLYYWQLRKRRKLSDASESDAPNSSSLAEHIASDIREDCTDSSCQESAIPLVDCSPESGLISCTASAKNAISVEAAVCALEPNSSTTDLTARDNQSTISLDSGDNIPEDSDQIPASASTQLSQEHSETEQPKECEATKSSECNLQQLSAPNCTESNPAPLSSPSLEEDTNVDDSTTPTESISEGTMHLKSSDNRPSAFSSPTSDCNDDLGLVGKMKHRLSISDETAPSNHIKVSSIDFEADSKSTNSILTIEVVPTASNEVDTGDTDTTEEKQLSSDETDKGNCESRLHQETTDDGGASAADNGPIINSNEISTNCDQPNIGAADSGETSAPVEADQQHNCPHPQTSPTAKAAPANKSAKPERKPSASSVKLSQTFAQVLSSSKNNSSNQATESNGSKQMPSPVDNQTVPITYASVAQEKEEADVYHNYPDATASQPTLSEGQCSPNSEFGECSDVHSQGSNDSGKGSSEILHAESAVNGDQAPSSPYHTVSPSDDQFMCYQFEMPHYLCGKLIGAGGHFINSCKQRSNTQIVVNSHFYSSENKICSITGVKENINIALSLIRRRFPIKEYPNVTLRQINLVNPIPAIPLSQACQLHLPPDIITDVVLSCTISAGHFFLQQPTHPSYPQLNQLDHCMKTHYSEGNAPQMPQVYQGLICAAPTAEGWYRALIKTVHESNSECDIMFVDYGGYAYNVPVSTLRQIRYDFLSLPFQASECYLSNVMPLDAENDWTSEANSFFDELARGQIIYASINGFAEDGIPFVNLFKLQGINRIFINKELVEKGHGQWVEHEPVPANTES